jgi:hypothetical protein
MCLALNIKRNLNLSQTSSLIVKYLSYGCGLDVICGKELGGTLKEIS